MGQNERGTIYDDIELICRDGKNVDRFADAENHRPVSKSMQKIMDCMLSPQEEMENYEFK